MYVVMCLQSRIKSTHKNIVNLIIGLHTRQQSPRVNLNSIHNKVNQKYHYVGLKATSMINITNVYYMCGLSGEEMK